MDHVSIIKKVDRAVSIERAENINQVSRLGFGLRNQEEVC